MSGTKGILEIDGSVGEGGGQVLRSSLALSMVLGRPFRIVNIRAGRERPGMMRQHVTAVQAAAEICGAKVDGAVTGSTSLHFVPGAVKPGAYTFSIGTAGSTTLVLQAILPALMFAGGESTVEVQGGTHAKAAPPYEFFAQSLAPLMEPLGANVVPELKRIGFYPAGGGVLLARVVPGEVKGLHLHSRGQIRSRKVQILMQRVPFHVALRELAEVERVLGWTVSPHDIVKAQHAISPGNVVTLTMECERITETFCAIGQVGKSAERVAGEAIDQVREYLAHDVCVGEHLADQLMVPMVAAWARTRVSSSFTTYPLSRHATTNAQIIEMFLPGSTRSERTGECVRWSVG